MVGLPIELLGGLETFSPDFAPSGWHRLASCSALPMTGKSLSLSLHFYPLCYPKGRTLFGTNNFVLLLVMPEKKRKVVGRVRRRGPHNENSDCYCVERDRHCQYENGMPCLAFSSYSCMQAVVFNIGSIYDVPRTTQVVRCARPYAGLSRRRRYQNMCSIVPQGQLKEQVESTRW